jgi:hypothetical protein
MGCRYLVTIAKPCPLKIPAARALSLPHFWRAHALCVYTLIENSICNEAGNLFLLAGTRIGCHTLMKGSMVYRCA